MNILFQLRSTPLNHLWAHQAAGSLQRQTQRKWRGYSGRSILEETLPKTGLFFKSIFVVKGSHRHLSTGSPARHLISARTWRAPSETIPLESGWVQIKIWAFGWLLCLFPTRVSFILVFLSSKGHCVLTTLTPRHPKTQIQVHFLKTNDWGLVLYFCFPPAIVYLGQQKWVYSFIFKKPPINLQWLFEYKIFIPWLQITAGSLTTQQVLLVQIHFRFKQAGEGNTRYTKHPLKGENPEWRNGWENTAISNQPHAYATGSELFRVEEPVALATMEGGTGQGQLKWASRAINWFTELR